MYQLGLNLSHDASIALAKDGEILLATEEERLTTIKHNRCDEELIKPYSSLYYPVRSMQRMFDEFEIEPGDIDAVVFSTAAEFVNGSLVSVDTSVFGTIAEQFSHDLTSARIVKNSHHFSHFWSARCMSEASRVVGVVVDGSGNPLNKYPDLASFWERSSIFIDEDGLTSRVQLVLPFHYYSPRLRRTVRSTNSIGEFFRRVAVAVIPPGNEPEGSMMALASFGDADRYYRYLMGFVSLGNHGQYHIHEQEFIESDPAKSWDDQPFAFVSPDGRQIDLRNGDLEELADIAAATQMVFETLMLHLVSYAEEIAADSRTPIACAGGAFLNCVLNERMIRALHPRKVLLQPASHDGGVALGCVASATSLGTGDSLRGVPEPPFLGFSPTPRENGPNLVEAPWTSARYVAAAVEVLVAGGAIGLCVGPAEFGPRALGHRSILADGSQSGTAEKMNKLKQRASFRPFACSILSECWGDFFESPVASPSMMRALPCHPGKRGELGDLIHIDGTCRIQVVDETIEPLYSLLNGFYSETGRPFLLNTSLNLKGKPIAQDEVDAFACYETLPLEGLFLERGFMLRGSR